VAGVTPITASGGGGRLRRVADDDRLDREKLADKLELRRFIENAARGIVEEAPGDEPPPIPVVQRKVAALPEVVAAIDTRAITASLVAEIVAAVTAVEIEDEEEAVWLLAA
jgi:hypothetical protein